jgi:geranylgeranyl diphosphate synthase type II
MSLEDRIERALRCALEPAFAPGHPPRLAAAMAHAVFPGGARVRPTLVLAVAAACGDDDPVQSDGAAAAIELLHCASLVHDDLPCFDDAAVRRGRPSVHAAFDPRIAVLAGDALIVQAFDAIVRSSGDDLSRLRALLGIVSEGVGMPFGIAAGQAWECESQQSLSDCQAAKTGALFAAATMAGAAAAGRPAEPWRLVGQRLGRAYQVADDLRDVICDAATTGKPAGRDAALGRPSMARELGIAGARLEFARLVATTLEAVPDCRGAAALRGLIRHEAARLVPAEGSTAPLPIAA